MEEEDMLSPLWSQTSDTRRHRHRHLRRSYSVLLNSSALIVVFSVVALSFIFIVLPTLHSFVSHIFKPQLVKKGWDLLNVVLVLFAIVCGFLGRNYNEGTSSDNNPSSSNDSQSQETMGLNQSTPRSWYEHSDRPPYNRINRFRSSSSYPDLRQESPWIDNGEGWRYYDDSHISSYRTFGLNHHQHLYQRQLREEGNEEEEIGAKIVEVDTNGVSTKESTSAPPETLPSPPPPPPPPPPPQSTPSPPPLSSPPPCSSVKLTKRSYQAIGKIEESEVQQRVEWEGKNFLPPPSPLPPPPLLEPTMLSGHGNEISGKNGKKRATATKDFLSTLRRRRKKQRQRSIESFDALSKSQSSSVAVETSRKHRTAPPPPPPPPPPSVFQSLFTTKKGKQKKVQPTPTPPPTLSPRKPRKLSTRKEKTKSYAEASTAYSPSLPMKVGDVTRPEENVNKGNESPLISIPPPPPPPPPFKVRKWKFAVQGDFIRINSMSSSRSSSPDLDDGEESPSSEKIQLNSTSEVQGRETALFCPSPDVDLKANRFIERFRAGLKLEKVNSMNEKQSRGKSNLGQSQIHSPETQAMQPS